MDPGGSFYYRWLSCVSLAVLYNSVFIIARTVFWKLNNLCPVLWFTLDCLCDLIYLLDMMVAARTGQSAAESRRQATPQHLVVTACIASPSLAGYLEQGLMVRDANKLLSHYFKTWRMKLDFASVVPTDVFYFTTGITCTDGVMPCPVVVRVNRLFKIHRLFEFSER